MEKVNILKQISNSPYFSVLTEEELKLFILLLVNVDKPNTKGVINTQQIDLCLGKKISLNKLIAMLDLLEKFEMILLEEISGDAKSGGIKFIFKILYFSSHPTNTPEI